MAVHVNRRKFIRQSFLGGALVPFSTLSLGKLAFAQNNPKLKIVFAVIPDGFAVDAFAGYDDGLWFPQTNDVESTNFAINEMSQHLGEYTKQSLFLRGLILGSGTGGHNGWQTVLRDSSSSQTSIDLLLGNALPGSNPALKRVYSGPHSMVGATWNISYSDNTMLLPEDNPYSLFESIFGDLQNAPSNSGQAALDDSHIFDPVLADIQALQQRLGAQERLKLESHLGAVEQVVSDIQNTLVPSGSCNAQLASPTPGMDINSAAFRDEVTQAHANIIASTLSCGISRVATLQIGRSADPVVIRSVSSTRNPHDCAHRYGDVNEWRDSRAWYVQQVKYLLDRLSTYPDPDVAGDSVLDHTLVVFTSEMADGAPEHMQDLPITLIGGASGMLNNGTGNGRFLDLSSQGDRTHWKLGQTTDVQRVWSTIANAVGVSVPYGGDTSVLSGIFR